MWHNRLLLLVRAAARSRWGRYLKLTVQLFTQVGWCHLLSKSPDVRPKVLNRSQGFIPHPLGCLKKPKSGCFIPRLLAAKFLIRSQGFIPHPLGCLKKPKSGCFIPRLLAAKFLIKIKKFLKSDKGIMRNFVFLV